MTARLTEKQKKAIRAHVLRAQLAEAKAQASWAKVAAKLDAFGSHGHSQCCPIGGMRAAGRNGFSGETPCPCGWEEP